MGFDYVAGESPAVNLGNAIDFFFARGTPCVVLIDESAEAALAQIKAKDYAAPYRARNLPIWAIGLNFDSKTRQLTGAVHERLTE